MAQVVLEQQLKRGMITWQALEQQFFDCTQRSGRKEEKKGQILFLLAQQFLDGR